MTKQIPLYKAHMPANIASAIEPVLLSGYYSQGPKTALFESKVQDYVGNKYTAVVNSGTSAITLALRMSGVGPGTEVISSPLSCIATNEPILTLGADVVWCDVDPRTGNIDPSKIEKLITKKTKAIIFVDWSGTPAELEEINYIAYRNGIKTIEDAAHSFGACYKGARVGSLCSFTCFSFQAIKMLNVCDGGAIACSSKEDYDRAVLLRWFGMKRGGSNSPVCWEGDASEPGYKMNMNDVNASIGLEQFKYIDSIVSKHRKNGFALMSGLSGVPNLQVCEISSYIQPSFWFFIIKLLNSEHRAAVSEKLIAAGVYNSISHTRNDVYSMFSKFSTTLPGLDDFSNRMLNIPCGWWCTDDDIDYIIEQVKMAI